MSARSPLTPEDIKPINGRVSTDLVRLFVAYPARGQANLAAALATAAALHETASHTWVIAWLVAQAGLSGLMFHFKRRTGKHRVTDDNAQSVARIATLGAAMVGLLWLVGVQIFWPGSNDWQRMLLVCVVVALCTSAALATHAHPPVFWTIAGFSTAGVVLAELQYGGNAAAEILAMLALFSVVNLRFSATLHRQVRKSLQSQHEIEALAAKLQVQTERALSLSQSRSRFLAVASHDLRQPVHALALFVSALKLHPPAPEAERIVAHVSSAVDAMGELFNALLDISKLDAEMVQPSLKAVSLAQMLARLAADVAPMAQSKQLSLHCQCPQDGPLWALTDPQLLERILRNLLSNAVRYTDQGRVVVRARRHGATVRVVIADTGRGIPKARQQEAFEEFVQLHNPVGDRERGLGLGLAIVKRLVELLNIPLRLRSAPGRGTVFSLRLPLTQGPAALLSRPDPASPASAPHLLQPGDVVLVIDDNTEIQVAMVTLIATWGCRVYSAASAAELMPKLMALDRTPRIVVCDHSLRDGQTGAEAIAQLHAAFNDDIAAIVVTGDTNPQRLREAAAGGWPLLHKPVTEQRLREAIAVALATTGDPS